MYHQSISQEELEENVEIIVYGISRATREGLISPEGRLRILDYVFPPVDEREANGGFASGVQKIQGLRWSRRGEFKRGVREL